MNTHTAQLLNHNIHTYTADKLPSPLIHCSYHPLALDDIQSVKTTRENTTKPHGTLWLSPGHNNNGIITTAWEEFCNSHPDWLTLPHSIPLRYQVELYPTTNIMELTSDTDIAQLWELGALQFNPQYPDGIIKEIIEIDTEEGFEEEFVERTITKDTIADNPLKYCTINYPLLREMGVGAVRVQGQKFFEHETHPLAEWGTDSIALLDHNAISHLAET